MSLAELFDKHGTDKGWNHDYGPTYEKYVNPELVHSMVELGVQEGSSLLAWLDWFPTGTRIYGLDINPDAGEKVRGTPITFYHADVRSPFPFDDQTFDFIVDDASHEGEQIEAAFSWLWPRLLPGGWYAVEDLVRSEWHPVSWILNNYRDVEEAHVYGELALFRRGL